MENKYEKHWYILLRTDEFDLIMRNELKQRHSRGKHYLQDSVDTLVKYQFVDSDSEGTSVNEYYVLSWKRFKKDAANPRDKPTSIFSRYDRNPTNPDLKSYKIWTAEDLRTYIVRNAVIPETHRLTEEASTEPVVDIRDEL